MLSYFSQSKIIVFEQDNSLFPNTQSEYISTHLFSKSEKFVPTLLILVIIYMLEFKVIFEE